MNSISISFFYRVQNYIFFLIYANFFVILQRKIKIAMKRSLFYAIIVVAMMSCSGNSNRLLTSATGSIYECIVVSPASVSEALCDTMRADMYGLPQMEATFTTSHVLNSQFDDLFKASRNILIADIDEHKYTMVKTTKSRNVWSTPQAVIRIQAPSKEMLMDYWQSNGGRIREWFVEEELARQVRFYSANTNKEARAKLQKKGYDMLIPEDYIIIKNEKLKMENEEASVEVLWCCNNKGPMRKDILVYSYPYTAQSQFSNDSIISMRNKVVGQLVSGQVEGSYMGTEYRHFPPVSRSVHALRDSIGGFYGIETRGLWKLQNGEAMGGPFVSLTRLDQANGRVVTAEAFLFAAGQKKRNAMRQMEAILYTLKMKYE